MDGGGSRLGALTSKLDCLLACFEIRSLTYFGRTRLYSNLKTVRKFGEVLYSASPLAPQHSPLLQQHFPREPAMADMQLIRAAARHGRLDELKGYIAKGVDVNVTDEDGATPLLMACCYGHTSCVDVLLKANADPNVAGKHGITPVFFTCQENHPSCLKLLIARGANLDTPNSQDGGSPLYIACSKNNVECLRMLCEAGADVNKPRVDGSTGLQTAMRKKHKECVKLCIQYGAEIDKGLPPANKTPFQMAMDMVYAGDSKMRRSYLIGMLEQHEKRDLIAANEKLKAKVKELEASGRAFALKTPTTPILLPTPEPKKGKKSTSPKGGKKSDEEDGPTSAAPRSCAWARGEAARRSGRRRRRSSMSRRRRRGWRRRRRS